jgi:hypothetical protein
LAQLIPVDSTRAMPSGTVDHWYGPVGAARAPSVAAARSTARSTPEFVTDQP